MSRPTLLPANFVVLLVAVAFLSVCAGFAVGPQHRNAAPAPGGKTSPPSSRVSTTAPPTSVAAPPKCRVLRPILPEDAPSFIAGPDADLVGRVGALLPGAVQLVGTVPKFRALLANQAEGVLIVPYEEKGELDVPPVLPMPVVFIATSVDSLGNGATRYQAVVLRVGESSSAVPPLAGSETFVADLITKGSAATC